MKVRLLNSGGYGFKKGTKFPVEVEGAFEVVHGLMEIIHITKTELIKVGLKGGHTEGPLMFFLGKEAEIIEDTTTSTPKPTKKLIGFKIKNFAGEWFLAYDKGTTEDKAKAHVYPLNFMDSFHFYHKDKQVLIPVYE